VNAAPLVVQVELTRATGLLLSELYGASAKAPPAQLGWPGGAGAIPNVGETVVYGGMDEYPMRVVVRRWEIVPGEFRLILQLGIDG
jgi:hypothetical protein